MGLHVIVRVRVRDKVRVRVKVGLWLGLGLGLRLGDTQPNGDMSTGIQATRRKKCCSRGCAPAQDGRS